MEEIKSSNSSNNKQIKQKIVVGGVGGIAGVLILAGAFAAASFIKNKGSNKKPDTINLELEGPPSPTQKTNISNKEEGSEGLRSILQTSSSSAESHNCSSSSSIEHDPSKGFSTDIGCHLETKRVETTNMEEISTIEVNVEEQISTGEGKMIEPGNSNSDHSRNNSNSEEVESKLLCSAVQILSPSVESHQSSIEHEASKAISTQVNDHSETETAEIMIMEETSVTTDYVEENVSIRDDHKNESGNSKDENLCTDDIDMIKAEIFSGSSEESPSWDIDEGLLIHSIEEEDQSDSRVTVSIIKESDLPDITHVSEENLLMPIKEVEEYDGEEDKTERETKSSEDSFIGSNSEKVCPLKVTPIQIDNHSETDTTEAPIKHEISTMENYVDKETSTWEDQRLESGNLKAESLWTLNIVDKTEDGSFLASCGGSSSSFDIDEAIFVVDSIKKNHSDLASTIAEGDQPEATHVNGAFVEEIPPVTLKEVEYAGEGDEMEREREDSEGTPDSSIESNSEAVWPTELIEEELSLLKDNEHTQILRHKNDKETSKEAQFEVAFNNLSSLSMNKEIKLLCPPFLIKSRPEFWLWSLLAVALVCLFFGNHLPIIYHRSDTQL